MKKALISLSLLGSVVMAGSSFAADLAPPPAPAPVLVPGVPSTLFEPFPVFKDREPPVVIQLGPTSSYSTLNCANFVKNPDGTWSSIAPVPFSLGFADDIVPPVRPIKSGSNIYNNIDLYSQLNEQCGAGVVVKAKY